MIVNKINWNDLNQEDFSNKDNDVLKSQTITSNFRLSETLKRNAEKNYQVNHNIPDLTGVKSKIDTGLRKTKNIFQEIPKKDEGNEMENLYNDLEKNNKDQLKEYIGAITEKKKEKRNNYFDSANSVYNIYFLNSL